MLAHHSIFSLFNKQKLEIIRITFSNDAKSNFHMNSPKFACPFSCGIAACCIVIISFSVIFAVEDEN